SAAVRQVGLACGPPEAVFSTSGTTSAAARGRHLVPHLALYRASALATFARFVLPDAARLPCLSLVPPPALRPDSSLVQMCVWVGEALARGIPGYCCVNEYGMTELCSQRYDSALDDRFHGRSLAPRRLAGPPWLRTRVLDPDTLAPVAPGASGLLCHHDLANAGSVSVVLS